MIDAEMNDRMLREYGESLRRNVEILNSISIEQLASRQILVSRVESVLDQIYIYALTRFLKERLIAKFDVLLQLLFNSYQKLFDFEIERRKIGKGIIQPYDACAIRDIDYVVYALCLISISTRAECARRFEQTDYGRYQGGQKVNCIQGILMRTLRAYMKGDVDWLFEEYRSIETVKISKDYLFAHFVAPKRYWQALICSLFIDRNRSAFDAAYRDFSKYYTRIATKKLATAGGVAPRMAINYILSALGRIAVSDLNWKWIDDEFVPIEFRKLGGLD